jgi:prepilin-type processing-associated H-X9-DG protein
MLLEARLPGTNLNWVNDQGWSLSEDNTNTAMFTESSLGRHANKAVKIYRRSPTRASLKQREAGWWRGAKLLDECMVGDAGELSATGVNTNNPYYVQFFKLSAIPRPARIFVFLDEHPDSINDGYYLNKVYWEAGALVREWVDLPASYHNGAAAFSFADGHSQIQRWAHALTKQPAKPDVAALPFDVPGGAASDFDWVVTHMSLSRE